VREAVEDCFAVDVERDNLGPDQRRVEITVQTPRRPWFRCRKKGLVMGRHTSGPWGWVDKQGVPWDGEESRAELHSNPGIRDSTCILDAKFCQEARKADALLIAAAPDLFYACKRVEGAWREFVSKYPDPNVTKSMEQAVHTVRNAIAAAQGRVEPRDPCPAVWRRELEWLEEFLEELGKEIEKGAEGTQGDWMAVAECLQQAAEPVRRAREKASSASAGK